MKLNEIIQSKKMLTDHKEIKKWLNDKNIFLHTVTIDADNTVHVNDDVDLAWNDLIFLPVKFGRIGGFFDISANELTSFDNFPSEVAGQLAFSGNNITSLVGISDVVKKVNGLFQVSEKIKEGGIGILLIEGVKSISNFGDYSNQGDWDGEALQASQIIRKYLNKPENIFECQTELIEAGLEKYAIL